MDLVRHNLKLVDLDVAQIAIGEYEKEIPFIIKRFYLITNFTEEKSIHGNHALQNADQAFVLIKGEAKCTFIDRNGEEMITDLVTLSELLVVPKKMWRTVVLQPNSILLSFASEVYDKDDYISDLDIYLGNKIKK